MTKPSIAIVGTGIAGMGCAHFLHQAYDITLFEKNDYVGGHTHTVEVVENGKRIPVDTGFIVFNHETYPNLTQLFNQLQVPIDNSIMSFSVQHKRSGLEWGSENLNGVFGQRKNLFSLSFYRMLLEINRFNRLAPEVMNNDALAEYSIADYMQYRHFSNDLLEKYCKYSVAPYQTIAEQIQYLSNSLKRRSKG